jgi:hypothetical protein
MLSKAWYRVQKEIILYWHQDLELMIRTRIRVLSIATAPVKLLNANKNKFSIYSFFCLKSRNSN